MASSGNLFKEWVLSEGLESRGDVEQFRGTRIAIDAEDYLSSLLITPDTREPLLPALGGLPFALQKHVDDNLAHFKAAGIDTIFVFNGLDLAAKDHAAVSRESRKATDTLNQAWRIYDAGEGDSAVIQFGKACTYRTQHIVRWLHAHLHKSGVFVQTAPYSAAAQALELERSSWASVLAGPADLLIYGAEKVIISFDFKNSRVTWVEAHHCHGKLMLQPHQFADLMLLSGCTNLLPALPEVDMNPTPSRISGVRGLLNRVGLDGHTVCLQSKDEEYLSAFRKARYAIKHPVVITEDGRIEPRNADALPNDAHEFIGQRLPDEVYFYLTRGVVGPRVLNWRTRMQIFEVPPLDGRSSQAYRDLIQDKLRPLRTQALALFTRPLHRYYQKTDVDLICWFSESEKRPLGIPDLADTLEQSSIPVDSWRVKESDVSELGKANNHGSLWRSFSLLTDDENVKKTVHASKTVLKTVNEMISNSVWRFLHDRGYINADHTLSAWGKALFVAFEHANTSGYCDTPQTSSKMEEAIFMAFELLRLDILNAKNMFPTPPYTGAPHRGSESDNAHTLLISRIACLGTFKHRAIGYTGPLSRHLLAYHQMTAAIRNGLRDLVEMHACYMLLSGAVDRDVLPKDLTTVGTELPFVDEPDLGLALVVMSHLDDMSNDPSKRSDITKWFSYVLDIDGDLAKAWILWSSVNAGIQAADSSIVNNETRKLFKNADEWLQNKKVRVVLNGTS